MQLGGFDKIANIYDGLARLVFGKSIQQAQEYLLNDVPPESKILILGGGTGWLLANLLELKPACEVWYIEASEKMLELSKEKIKQSDRVHFLLGTENSIPGNIQFDVVITNFYLDLFTTLSLDSVIEKIRTAIKPQSLWLATDFIESKVWWQSVLLKIMYYFFRMTCSIEASQLPDWNQQLAKNGLTRLKSKFFFGGLIEATAYSNKADKRFHRQG